MKYSYWVSLLECVFRRGYFVLDVFYLFKSTSQSSGHGSSGRCKKESRIGLQRQNKTFCRLPEYGIPPTHAKQTGYRMQKNQYQP